ncbi:protein NEDD1-like [Tachypleus tridentatus]|uniref:protein NEDD1-like n=1 Tax=Tachypleus tridentatus TaxID=6853 RepID=UPI003FD652B5
MKYVCVDVSTELARHYHYDDAELIMDSATCVAFNNRSSQFFGIGCKSGNVINWDIKSHKPKKFYSGHQDEVTCIHFNWNDSCVASGSLGGDILLHNITTGQSIKLPRAPKSQSIRGLEYGLIKKCLLGSISDNGSVSLWDVNTHQLTHTFTSAHTAPGTGLVFSPINNVLLISVGLDKNIISYDTQMKSILKSFNCDEPLTAVDFLDDGVTLAVGTKFGKIHIYDLRLATIPVKTWTAHNTSVISLAFQNCSNEIKPKKYISSKQSLHQCTSQKRNVEATQRKDNSHDGNVVITYYGSSTVPPDQADFSTSHTLTAVHVDSTPVTAGAHAIYSPVQDGVIKECGVECQNKLSSGSFEDSATLYSGQSDFSSCLYQSDVTKTPKDISLRNTEPSSCSDDVEMEPEPICCNDDVEMWGKEFKPSGSNGIVEMWGRGLEPSGSNGNVEMEEKEPEPNSSNGNVEMGEKEPEPNSSSGNVEMRKSENYTWPKSISIQKDKNLGSEVVGDSRRLASDFQAECVYRAVKDAVEEFRDSVHKDLLNLHMEIVQLLNEQMTDIHSLVRQYSVNEQLVDELERLQEENKELKSNF